MSAADVVAVSLVLAGIAFLALGGLGLLRFPDFFTRLHPAGKVDTMGAALVVAGLVVHEGFTLVAAKIALVQVFVLLASPTAAHAISRAAVRVGVRPFTKEEDG